MGNIGTPEILIVLIVALLVLGPTRLPQAARQVGKAMAEFRRVTGGLQAEMRDAMSSIESEIKSATDISVPETVTPPPAKPYIFEPPAVGPAAESPGPGMIAPPPEMVVEPQASVAEVAAAPVDSESSPRQEPLQGDAPAEG
ncbi:MAG: twin-arginine translocase TatA/TatE family subunit [Acidimicrobiales bacterium]|nr:twin-arginine translocase TatA/TatE family subunit [Acidimicrobiales bacterium]